MAIENTSPCPIIRTELEAFGLRATKPRMRALAALHSRGHIHFTAADLEDWAKLTTATAYNCLSVFVGSGLLKTINLPNSPVIYDTNIAPEAHFVDEAGQITDAPMPEIHLTPDAIPNGYEVCGIQVTITTKKVQKSTE